jgi:hypothetical protein
MTCASSSAFDNEELPDNQRGQGTSPWPLFRGRPTFFAASTAIEVGPFAEILWKTAAGS